MTWVSYLWILIISIHTSRLVQDKVDLAGIVIHKWVLMHGIYFLVFCPLNPAPGATARPPQARPVRPSNRILLRAGGASVFFVTLGDKLSWNCYIYYIIQWEVLILICGCFENHCKKWFVTHITSAVVDTTFVDIYVVTKNIPTCRYDIQHIDKRTMEK